MALISCAALICDFVFAYAKSQFSHDVAQLVLKTKNMKNKGENLKHLKFIKLVKLSCLHDKILSIAVVNCIHSIYHTATPN